MIGKYSDWLLFLSLERDFVSTIDYVEIDSRHDKTFSIAYLKILLSACSAIERLGKKYCKREGLASSEWLTIYSIRNAIIGKTPAFQDIECSIPRYEIWKLMPWGATMWKEKEVHGGKVEPAPWWMAYRASKHRSETYEDATQKNVIDCLAALFCLNLQYYGDDVREKIDPLPVLYDSERLPFAMRGLGVIRPDRG